MPRGLKSSGMSAFPAGPAPRRAAPAVLGRPLPAARPTAEEEAEEEEGAAGIGCLAKGAKPVAAPRAPASLRGASDLNRPPTPCSCPLPSLYPCPCACPGGGRGGKGGLGLGAGGDASRAESPHEVGCMPPALDAAGLTVVCRQLAAAMPVAALSRVRAAAAVGAAVGAGAGAGAGAGGGAAGGAGAGAGLGCAGAAACCTACCTACCAYPSCPACRCCAM